MSLSWDDGLVRAVEVWAPDRDSSPGGGRVLIDGVAVFGAPFEDVRSRLPSLGLVPAFGGSMMVSLSLDVGVLRSAADDRVAALTAGVPGYYAGLQT